MTNRKCRCGIDRKNKSGAWFCPNCDAPQPQEKGVNHQPRKRTPQDIRFDVYWTQEMREYPPVPDDWGKPART